MANPAAYPDGTKAQIHDGAVNNKKNTLPVADQKATQHPRGNETVVQSGKVR